MIEISNLSFQYKNSKRKALDNINFTFENTGLYYIIGESGSGKSTLFYLLSNLIKNYSGNILVNKKELKEKDYKETTTYLHSELSVLLQNDVFEEQLTLKDNFLLVLETYDLSILEKENLIFNISNLLVLSSLLNHKLKDLSGGELKRASLGRVLLKDTPILILDEPLGPLDELLRKRLTEYFEKIAINKLVIIITHNTSDIISYKKIIKLVDGKINNIYEGNFKSKENYFSKIKTKKASIKFLLKRVIKNIIVKRKHFLFTSFATSLALISLGLILLLTSSISSSFTNFLNSSFTNSTLLITKQENILNDAYYQSSKLSKVKNIYNRYLPYLDGISTFYDFNIEDTFRDKNKVYFSKGNKEFLINSLSCRSFLEFTYSKEINLNFEKELDYNDIILGLTGQEAISLLNFYSIPIKNDIFESINDYLKHNDLVIHLDIENLNINYSLENLFSVKKIFFMEKSKIIHNNMFFAEYFLEKQMCFKTYTNLAFTPYEPWVTFKSYILLVKKEKKEEFLTLFEKDELFKDQIIFPLKDKQSFYFQNDNNLTHNRYLVYDDYLESIEISDIYKMIEQYLEYIDSYYYSDSFYYISDEGLVSGFLKPIYVSSNKEHLNKIADYNYQAQFDLEGFQGSTITYDENVVMGDLSNTSSNPLIFQSIVKKCDFLIGDAPKNYNEVVISSNLAKKLFNDSYSAINQNLYLSCLSEVKYIGSSYKNIFNEAEVKICGVIEDEKNKIYHEPYFLTYLGKEQFNLDLNTFIKNRVVINFEKDFPLNDLIEILKVNFSDYSFQMPIVSLENGVKEVLNYISIFLYSFVVFTSLIAGFLLTLVSFLFIKEDQEKIYLMRFLGYSFKDVFKYYCFLIVTMSLLAFISSSFTLFISNILFSKQLSQLLGIASGFHFQIYFINLILVSFISLASFLLSYFQIKKKFI